MLLPKLLPKKLAEQLSSKSQLQLTDYDERSVCGTFGPLRVSCSQLISHSDGSSNTNTYTWLRNKIKDH